MVSDADSNKVYVYDGQGTNVPIHVFERLHTKPVVIIKDCLLCGPMLVKSGPGYERTKSCQGYLNLPDLPLTLQGFGHSPEQSGFGDTLFGYDSLLIRDTVFQHSSIGCEGLVTRTLDSMVMYWVAFNSFLEREWKTTLFHSILVEHNPVFEVAVSVDQAGILEYWAGPKLKYSFPKCVTFESKLDTDLFEFAKAKTFPTGLCFSPDGKRFATLSADRKVRVFTFLTGKLNRVFDETLQRFSELQQVKQQLPNMEFGRRMAAERDLEKSDALNLANIVYDESGHFVMYSTMLGVKVVNLYTNKMVGIIGKPENLRPLKLALFQGRARRSKAAVTVEMEASENPTLDSARSDPTLFCTAFKKNRFYMFTRREPEDTKSQDADRDIFNEKPSKEDIISATEASGVERLYESAILHTALGDITIKLFGKECPRAVENFCVHSKNGYYNSHIFHRVIKGFMVQTGDPTGTGTGGESIWGGEFEDEFNSSLRHDRPYTLSMANAGPNTNGSQFFITLIPTPWLDNKHTVFGRVVKGMEVVQNISTVKTNPKTDKPYDDIQIVSITLK
uniref:peptidylprolyl isomerase n=2 Tax=Timema TaxID=61471 RepID=A0A7R9B0Y5_TIMSH|nr:unnamed protein product [Timema shepardi]